MLTLVLASHFFGLLLKAPYNRVDASDLTFWEASVWHCFFCSYFQPFLNSQSGRLIILPSVFSVVGVALRCLHIQPHLVISRTQGHLRKSAT